MTGLTHHQDGSITRDGQRVGAIVRTVRQVGGYSIEGWALKDANGEEKFWSAYWGDTKAHAVQFLGGVAHKLSVAA